MSDQPFISYGQNREDVVLWRALGSIPNGRYVEIGANDPTQDSITRAFYDRGWSGITVEPDPECAARHRSQRQRDIVVEAAIADRAGSVRLHLFPGTGLSTLDDAVRDRHVAAGREPREIEVQARRLSEVVAEHAFDDVAVHFLVIDVEGAEAEVLQSIDLRQWRPWVLVVEATEPNSARSTHHSWEPRVVEAGYRLCLFDGVSRFYVAEEHAQTLASALSYPACVLDEFVDMSSVHRDAHISHLGSTVARLEERLEVGRTRHVEDVLRWRTVALGAWAAQVGDSADVRQLRDELHRLRDEAATAHREVHAIHETISWRVTKPLRAARHLKPGSGT